MITVDDVALASKWYQKVLGLKSAHGGDEYDMLVDGDRLVMQLHSWHVEHEHDRLLGRRALKSRGNGSVMWFSVIDFNKAVARVKRLHAAVLKPAGLNPLAGHREIWLRDLDGYTVVLSGPFEGFPKK